MTGGAKLRLIIPLSAVAIGVLLLVGCIYVPTPEMKADGSQTDFFPLLKDSAGVSPTRPGVARAAVIATLGKPPYVAEDQRSIAYTLTTMRGFTIYPLCAYTEPAATRMYAVRLTFDDQDHMVGMELVHKERGLKKRVLDDPLDPQAPIDVLNEHGPQLHRVHRPRHVSASKPATDTSSEGQP